MLLLSPSLRQSSELFRKVKAGLAALGTETADLTTDNALSLETSAGSRIVSLPGKEGVIRGYSGVRLLVIDEAARVPDDLYRAVRPMLAVSGGRLIAMSTPFGTRGWWYEAWEHGGDAWERYEVPATLCPRIPPAFLAAERRDLPAWVYAQEYECKFEEAEDAVFTSAEVAAMLDPEAQPFFPTLAATAPGGVAPVQGGILYPLEAVR